MGRRITLDVNMDMYIKCAWHEDIKSLHPSSASNMCEMTIGGSYGITSYIFEYSSSSRVPGSGRFSYGLNWRIVNSSAASRSLANSFEKPRLPIRSLNSSRFLRHSDSIISRFAFDATPAVNSERMSRHTEAGICEFGPSSRSSPTGIESPSDRMSTPSHRPL